MREVKVPKLCRDKMPEIWERYGDKVEYRYLSGAEKAAALRDKILEEANEVYNATGNDLVEEIGDLLEVVLALAEHYQIPENKLVATQYDKRERRGGFHDGLYLTKFEWGPQN